MHVAEGLRHWQKDKIVGEQAVSSGAVGQWRGKTVGN